MNNHHKVISIASLSELPVSAKLPIIPLDLLLRS